jgi:hypothetical protein
MPKPNSENRKVQLALALAGGATVSDWAEKNNVSERTAYRLAASPEVRERVEAIRRDALEQAVGRLSGNAGGAAEQINRLAREANSEAVRLQASRAVLDELMTVSSYAALERRLAEVERRLAGLTRSPVGDPGHDAAGLSGLMAGDWQPGEEASSCPAS